MPTKLGLAFLDFAVFLTISQVQQRVIESRGPAATQAITVQYAQLSPLP